MSGVTILGKRPAPPSDLEVSRLDRKYGGTVQRSQLPYWKERGWKRLFGKFRGYFRTKYGSWRGEATLSPGGRVEMFIFNPPALLEGHPHGICFMDRGGGKYFVHTSDNNHDLSSGIIRVEQILTEAFKL